MGDNKPKPDLFAGIAATGASEQQKGLTSPVPVKLSERVLPSMKSNSTAAFKPTGKVDTPEKLERELIKRRRWAERFMKNLAPVVASTRTQKKLRIFDWRIETNEDAGSFLGVLDGKGEWKQVSIPHYGEPLGRAVTYYRTIFKASKAMLAKGAVFICFKGVDYKAHAFVNGSYVGSHEGFFAPFEFDVTKAVIVGENTLVVKVENDAICMGNQSWGEDGCKYMGDKLYAATGPGYDEPQVGWHHCPPGMGIYQDVFVEARATIHIHDIFVRSIHNNSAVEVLVEVFNSKIITEDIGLDISIFGYNFKKTIFRNRRYEVNFAGPTSNYYKIDIDIPDAMIWQPDSPWLYQIEIKVLNAQGKVFDVLSRLFGIRTFLMDETDKPKGRFYLNNQNIRLRGANTMGHLQQCVIKNNWDQLRDDILLAKICNMNFLRFTQRPVQSEIYDLCDQLGMMTQTDLPLFGVLRRNQFCEAVRQAEEMEILVRNHPCNIIDSYINEPFPVEWEEHYRPHRNLNRKELEAFFMATNQVVRLANPDRVIKPVDGDYNPPADGLPDNHCYCGWYVGHGIDMGKLHKGYWQKVKPNWFYGCGEFGAEGLESIEVMRKYYPRDWLPATDAEMINWTPDRIPTAQSGNFHYAWFDTQHTVENWVEASQAHQAWVTRLMTEAFRRDCRMNTFAVHLFIDAFPAGWMKSIMDVERQPKQAFFSYRNALEPLMVHWRTDRYSFLSGEQMELEAWVCNDRVIVPGKVFLHYQVELNDKVIFSQKTRITVPSCDGKNIGLFRQPVPVVDKRTKILVRIGLLDKKGNVLNDNAITLDVFPQKKKPLRKQEVSIIGDKNGKAYSLSKDLGLYPVIFSETTKNAVVLIDDIRMYKKTKNMIDRAVKSGAIAVFLELPEGTHKIGNSTVKVDICGMGPRHFVSRSTAHPLVEEFLSDDFRFWFDFKKGYVTPLLETVFVASDFQSILISGNPAKEGGLESTWSECLAVGEKVYGAGIFRICQVSIAGRSKHNPVASLFARRILSIV